MNYEKKYLIIKSFKNSKSDEIFGYVKLEKDGRVKIKYSLSVFSLFVNIIVLSDNKILKEFKNKNIVGQICIQSQNISNLQFVFSIGTDIFVAGDVNLSVLQRIKYKLQALETTENTIEKTIKIIFEDKRSYSFYEYIKNPLTELFNHACHVEVSGVLENHESNWVRIKNGGRIEIVGKIYDKSNNEMLIAMGEQVETVGRVNKKNLFSTNLGEFIINFYDIFTGEPVKIN